MKKDIISTIVIRLMQSGIDETDAFLMLTELLLHLAYEGDITLINKK